MSEEFRIIAGFDDYMITNLGRVFSRKTERFLKNQTSHDGYSVIILNKTICRVHRLVATAFLYRKGGIDEVDHIDGNKCNNHLENLRWVTREENAENRIRNGSQIAGEKHPLSKLNQQAVEDIRNNLVPGIDGRLIGVRSYARKYKVSDMLIRLVAKGIGWKDVKPKRN